MQIGSIGDVSFSVCRQRLLTFRELVRSRKVKNAKHDVLEGRPRLQHTGRDLDGVTLTVVLERMLPGDPAPDEAIKALLEMAEIGDEVPLVFGSDYWGLWFLEQVEATHREFHGGVTWRGTVALTLTEYN